MDGAFRPNDLLDAAPPIVETPAPDCLAVTSQGLVVSSQRSLFRVDRPGGAPLASFDAEISALAGLPDGGAAVGLIDGRIVFVGGQHDGTDDRGQPRDDMHHRARAGARTAALLVANGSASNGPAAWKRDLMEKNASGSVWRIEPAERRAHSNWPGTLAYPYGLARRSRLDRRFGELAQRVDANFTRRRRPQRAGAGEPSRLSQPPVAEPRRRDLARPVRAAKPARRIRVERRPAIAGA